MQLYEFESAPSFARRVTPFLLRHEADHNLFLGMTARLQDQPPVTWGAPLLATVERAESVIATAVRLPPANLVLSRTDDLAALPLLAAAAHRHDAALPGAYGPPCVVEAFAGTWRHLTGQLGEPTLGVHIMQLDQVIPVTGVPGEARLATAADRELISAWAVAFAAETKAAVGSPATIARGVDRRLAAADSGYLLWYDGEPVSLAGYAHPTPGGIRIAPVYTPPAHRSRGYASALTATLSQRLLTEGQRSCYLLTDAADAATNRIYDAIGFRTVATAVRYEFGS